MDGTLQFLLIAGINVIGIVKQFKKEAKKNADNKPIMPPPEAEIYEDTMPIPENWGETYGGFIPEGPAPEPTPAPIAKEVTKKHTFSSQKSFLPGESARKSAYSPVVDPDLEVPPPPSVSQNPSTENEYTIHSAEEAQKAIIWSEILQRKY